MKHFAEAAEKTLRTFCLAGDPAWDQLQDVDQWLSDQTHPENHQVPATTEGLWYSWSTLLCNRRQKKKRNVIFKNKKIVSRTKKSCIQKKEKSYLKQNHIPYKEKSHPKQRKVVFQTVVC